MSSLNFKIFIYTVFGSIILTFFSCKDFSLKGTETSFNIQDTNSVEKIIIKNKNDSIVLVKLDKYWLVNDKYVVDDEQIERTLMTLKMVSMNTPFPENAREIIKSELKKNSFITIWNSKKIIKQFYLGKYVKESGNYFMLNNSENPYLVHIEGHDFDLNKNFSLDIIDWQSRILFHFEPQEINHIYYKDFLKNYSYFVFTNNSKYYYSKDTTRLNSKVLDNKKAEYYFSQFKNVSITNFITNILDEEREKILINPIFELDVMTKKNIEIKLIAYPFIKNDGQIDNENFIGVINQKDIIVAKYYNFDLQRKEYSYFEKE